MTTIVCRSTYIASELAAIAGPEKAAICPVLDKGESAEIWLSGILANNSVSVVFYEPSFFIDPAPYRKISPGTRFVVLAGPGDEQDALYAMICGACAVIGKPLVAQDVNGVLSLVSR